MPFISRRAMPGGGWLIFALPPAELAVHPATAPNHELGHDSSVGA
jgi:hypothetical protein